MKPEERIRRLKPEHVDGTRSAHARRLAITRRQQRSIKYA